MPVSKIETFVFTVVMTMAVVTVVLDMMVWRAV